MSYRFVDSFRAGPGWNCSSIHKFVKLVHLVGFIIKKFVTMHGHINLKKKVYFKIYAYRQEPGKCNSTDNFNNSMEPVCFFRSIFYNLEVSTCVMYDPMQRRQSGGQRNVHTDFV